MDKRDIYGNNVVIRSLQEKDYDLLFVMNDTFATSQVAAQIKKIQEDKLTKNKKTFKIIYYYPIDCSLQPEWASFIRLADIPVAYTEYGKIKTKVHNINVNDVIYHGTDVKQFGPLVKETRQKARKELFQIEDDETFLWGNFNRNSIRKDISKTLLAFKDFKRQVPNSKLYLHMATSDGTFNGGVEINLLICIRDLNLELGKDVMFPQNYKVGTGVSDKMLNLLMNCCDGGITTATSEGYGLCVPEMMACGTPVVVPNNTSFPEIIGKDRERGYVYQCKERVVIDSCGYRKIGRTEDIVRSMMNCYKERNTEKQKEMIKRAFDFTRKYSWENIVKQQWIPIFKRARSIIYTNKEAECL